MADKCAECDRLWAELAEANIRLLAIVERKYEQKEQASPDMETQIRCAIEDRQRLKQRILSHECGKHASKQVPP